MPVDETAAEAVVKAACGGLRPWSNMDGAFYLAAYRRIRIFPDRTAKLS